MCVFPGFYYFLERERALVQVIDVNTSTLYWRAIDILGHQDSSSAIAATQTIFINWLSRGELLIVMYLVVAMDTDLDLSL